MKWNCAFLLSCVVLAAAAQESAPKPKAAPAPAAEAAPAPAQQPAPVTLASLRRVLVLPMANGIDQYIANRITNLHVVEVVTDPKLADAVLTDHIGQGFQERMAQLYEAPKAPAAKAKPETTDQSGQNTFVSAFATAAPPPQVTSWGRGKGNVFLVGVGVRQVLWSAYERPEDNTSGQLDRTAIRIVNRLQKDIARTKEGT